MQLAAFAPARGVSHSRRPLFSYPVFLSLHCCQLHLKSFCHQMRFAAFAPLGLQLLCLFSIILNVPFKNLSNKYRKAFAPALRGLSPPTRPTTPATKKSHRRPRAQPHPPQKKSHRQPTFANTSRHKKNPPPPNPQARAPNPPIAQPAPTRNASAVPIHPSLKNPPPSAAPKGSAPAYQNIMPTSAACPRLPRKGLNPTTSKPAFPPLRPIPSKPHPFKTHSLTNVHRPTCPLPQRLRCPDSTLPQKSAPLHTQKSPTPSIAPLTTPTHSHPAAKNPSGFSDLLNISLLKCQQV